jgi:hypothetical protein
VGAPSQQQIEDAIAGGVAAGLSEEEIERNVAALERLADEELAALGIFPAPPRDPLEPRENLNAMPAPVRRTSDDVDSDTRLAQFAPAPTRNRRSGWTAERQRLFIETLAETGCVSEACAVVGLSARSAYKLRHRPGAEAFNEALVHAESMAATRLTALAFDRAVHGKSEYLFRDGVLVAERRTPSDRLLMWLISHLDPAGYGHLSRKFATNPRYRASERLPKLLDAFSDVADEDCRTESADLAAVAENEPHARA